MQQHSTPPTSSFRSAFFKALCATTLAVLAACGGGGGDSGASTQGTGNSTGTLSPTTPSSTPPATPPAAAVPTPVVSLAQRCVAPRPAVAATASSPAIAADAQGSIETEKAWVSKFMTDTYLWYKDIPAVNAAAFVPSAYNNSTYDTLDAYFEALKTKQKTASGKLVDEFSFTIPTADLNDAQAGISSGYGIRFAFVTTVPPRLLRVLYVQPGSPAELAGILRGDTVKTVDGVDININTDAGIDKLNAGINPAVATKTTVFGMQAATSTVVRNITVTSSQTVKVPAVPQSSVLASSAAVGTRTVGYLVLNSFSIDSAEAELITAVKQLKTANVNELVLDLRYNGGGYLAISSQLAWMVSDNTLAGKVFEKKVCNDKNPFSDCNASYTFAQTSLGISVPSGQPLPQLGLKRVFVLTSRSTCSASEAIINSLTPFMQVVTIGSTTCGKPYGFQYKDNCGTSYAAMQFKGVNANGFGDYADGLALTCKVADDLTKQRGDPTELMLSGALTYMRTGICPPVTTGLLKSQPGSADTGNYQVMRSKAEEVRLMSIPLTAR